MDEPLSNLDAKLRAEMRKEIRLLQQQLGITVIYVTHDQTEAMTMGDQVMLLNKGKIEQIGSPLELYNVPANTFVADFFGSPAINLIDVNIENDILKMKNGVTIPFNWEHINGPFKLGVRPENIVMTQSGEMTGTIVHIEPLGDGTNLEINLGLETAFRVKVSEQINLVIGDTINFDILLDKVLLFTQDGQLIKVGQSELVAVGG